MNDMSLIFDEQKKYKNLKNNINTIISYLNNAIENLEVPINRIGNSYSIDSVPIDKGNLNLLRQELIKKRDYLKNVVLIEINMQLKKIATNIEGM